MKSARVLASDGVTTTSQKLEGCQVMRDVGVIEDAGAHHEGFRGAAFFGRAAVIAHAPGHLVGGKPILHGGGGEQRGRAEQIVAAAMAMASGLERARLGHAGLLAETGQRVVFAEEGDDGTALAPFAHQRGRECPRHSR